MGVLIKSLRERGEGEREGGDRQTNKEWRRESERREMFNLFN